MSKFLPALGRAGANGLFGGLAWIAASALLYGRVEWPLAAAVAAAVAVAVGLLSLLGR